VSMDLVRVGLMMADRLEREGHPYAGGVRQLARAVLGRAVPSGAADRSCRGCGEALPYPGKGRPRVWCTEGCRRQHRP
jgi:hypothetical protein